MVEYLVGMKDYHKIVHYDKKCMTLIRTFNIPNSVTIVEMYMDNGWQIGFRLHNASSKVEPSLKFDVAFIGMPCSILCIECRWEKI